MRANKENDMKKGWFVGDFHPTCLATQNVEVAVKRYSAGDSEPKHHHRLATELTFVVSGQIEMNGIRFIEGDIITVEPNEAVEFKAVTDSINVVVKMPGAKDDKYLGEA